jgi:transcriptional regulator with XRE-family HTH domain
MKIPNYFKKLGSNILLRRKNARLSQSELAYKASIDINYLGEIERGEANPSTKVLWKICRSLKTTISIIYKGV